jgi:hypothetical protein
MLCKCWLDVPPDTSLFWYFYSPAHYEHNHQEEYLKVTFMGYWKGSSRRWFHVNFGEMPQWPNKHLLPPLIIDKQKNPEETPRLKVLIKQVTKLRQARLEACHYAEE